MTCLPGVFGGGVVSFSAKEAGFSVGKSANFVSDLLFGFSSRETWYSLLIMNETQARSEEQGRRAGNQFGSIYFKFTLIDSGIVQSVHGWSKGTYSWLWKRRTRTQLFIIFVFCIM